MTPQPENDTNETIIAQVYDIARSIPSGRVLSYGELGACCEPPISGYICGRIMHRIGPDVPWWRVVAKDGKLPVSKRSPHLARQQRELLEDENVAFDEQGRVEMDTFRWDGRR